jgi:hypothetical protein
MIGSEEHAENMRYVHKLVLQQLLDKESGKR